jgi:formate dehydrogenase gamma subunit
MQARGTHGWARLIYLGLIAVVLGGMFLHNLIVVKYELTKHFRHHRKQSYVMRWHRAERMQHLVLLLSFIGLAVTGFALRFPEAWWVNLLGLGGREALRQNLHRTLAIILIADSIYHFIWIVVTRRGRWTLDEIKPGFIDIKQFIQNMAFHLGWRKERPVFGAFDYTQKAEYWAVVWGTWMMALTGFILWFPTIATSWLPAWVVRVAEVIHFYEAILAVSAIVIWHFFYVIFLPSEYPMSTVWVNGRMPAKEWKEMHKGQYLKEGHDKIEAPVK